MAHAEPGSEPASAALLEFVLRNVQVRTRVCTRQVSEHGGYRCPRRTISDYNYIYVTRGAAVWHMPDGPCRIEAGELALIPPGLAHSGEGRTRKLTLGSIHVLATLPGGQDVFKLLRLPLHRPVSTGSRLWRYLNLSLEEFERADLQQTLLMMPAWGRLVTLELFRHDFQAGLVRGAALDPLVQAVLEKMNRQLDQPLSLEQLADFTGFSAQHVNRVFRRALGATPLQYLTRMRMERAAALLAEGTLTVRAVAEQVGYADPYYFSRLFKTHFCASPSSYRERGDSDSPS